MKLLLTMLSIFSVYALSAQKIRIITPYPKPEREIWISYGRMPLPCCIDEEYAHDFNNSNKKSFLIEFENGYLGTKYTTGTIAAGFFQPINERWDIGGNFTYTGYYRNIYNSWDDHKIGRKRSNYFSVLFNARRYWCKKPARAYSGAGLGICYRDRLLESEGKREKLNKGSVAFHFTLIGISVGKTWFVFSELGIGSNGFMNVGIGYRFNNQK